jgi:hypothetical protein
LIYKPHREMKSKKIKLELNKETIEVLDTNSMAKVNGAERQTTKLCYESLKIIIGLTLTIHETLDRNTECPNGPCTNPAGGGTQATKEVMASGCLLCPVVVG